MSTTCINCDARYSAGSLYCPKCGQVNASRIDRTMFVSQPSLFSRKLSQSFIIPEEIAHQFIRAGAPGSGLLIFARTVLQAAGHESHTVVLAGMHDIYEGGGVPWNTDDIVIFELDRVHDHVYHQLLSWMHRRPNYLAVIPYETPKENVTIQAGYELPPAKAKVGDRVCLTQSEDSGETGVVELVTWEKRDRRWWYAIKMDKGWNVGSNGDHFDVVARKENS